jgi:hypothetical protein
MAQTDAFALKNSGLGPFLFSEVGTEANGSGLTILSILARLGQDPWVEAAKWAKLPQAAMVERLAQCMAQMPLDPQAQAAAPATAARLFGLLPTQGAALPAAHHPMQNLQQFLPMLLCAALAISLMLGFVMPSRNGAHSAGTGATATTDSIVPGN